MSSTADKAAIEEMERQLKVLTEDKLELEAYVRELEIAAGSRSSSVNTEDKQTLEPLDEEELQGDSDERLSYDQLFERPLAEPAAASQLRQSGQAALELIEHIQNTPAPELQLKTIQVLTPIQGQLENERRRRLPDKTYKVETDSITGKPQLSIDLPGATLAPSITVGPVPGMKLPSFQDILIELGLKKPENTISTYDVD